MIETSTGASSSGRKRWLIVFGAGLAAVVVVVLVVLLLPNSKSPLSLRVIDRSGTSNPLREDLLISVPGQPQWSPLLRAHKAQHTFEGALERGEKLKLTVQDRGTTVLAFKVPKNADLSSPILRLVVRNNSYRLAGLGNVESYKRPNPFLASYEASKVLYDSISADVNKGHDAYVAVFGEDNTAPPSEVATVLKDSFVPALKAAKDRAVTPAGSTGPLTQFWESYRTCLSDSLTARESELFSAENPLSDNSAAEASHFAQQRKSCDASSASWAALSSEAAGK